MGRALPEKDTASRSHAVDAIEAVLSGCPFYRWSTCKPAGLALRPHRLRGGMPALKGRDDYRK